MHLFYTPDISGTAYTLNEEESRHAVRVLRLEAGDIIRLIDGKGGFYTAEIMDAHQKHCSVRVTASQKEFDKRLHRLHIAIAPTKSNDRTEWFVEKATEIGIDEISLLDCDNSERTVVKTERLQKVAIAAIKQSLKAYLPQIHEMSGFKKFISSTKELQMQKFIAHCHSREQLPHLKSRFTKGDALVLIGPEGDFSAEEVRLAVENGFIEISLGSSRLRTETAALYACTTINLLNND
ncbi:MAG: rRNA methyltransferase [Bacteroidetes bacterium]|nr:rRNA methyltransferase [Bacteroidota bacterium]